MQRKFITPGAPHQNGCAEALSLVKTSKSSLKKAIYSQVLTILLEVANLVNQRLIGMGYQMTRITAVTYVQTTYFKDVRRQKFYRGLSREQRTHATVTGLNSCRKLLNRDVFPSLLPGWEWQVKEQNVRPDVRSQCSPRKWSIGRSEKCTLPSGRYGRVRHVEVKTSTGIYNRPITKIAITHLAEGVRDKEYALIVAENMDNNRLKVIKN